MNNIVIDTNLKSEVIKVVLKANEEIMKIYLSEDFNIETKNDNTPVTLADLKAHKIITQELKRLTPNIPIVSEEDPKSVFIEKEIKLYWLIDPLDGTKEFIKKSGEFTCNIALIENNKPIYGFVGVPNSGIIYHGGKNMGSFKRINELKELKIKCSLQKTPLRIIMSKSHINNETLDYVKNIGEMYETVQAGSSLKFIRVAEGKADLYPRLGPTSEWDTAAAHAILEGAGGLVMQLNNEPLIYNKENILNPFFIAKGL